MQNRNRDAEVKKRRDTGAEGDGGMNWDIRIDRYTLTCVKLKAL